jgi:hypothetical protein
MLQLSLLDGKSQQTYDVRINDFPLYESKISLQLMENFRIVIGIIKEDKN